MESLIIARQTILRQQLAQLEQTAQSINQTTPQQESLEDIAKRLGIDRFRIGPIGAKTNNLATSSKRGESSPKGSGQKTGSVSTRNDRRQSVGTTGVNGLTCGEPTKPGGECKRVTKDGEPCWHTLLECPQCGDLSMTSYRYCKKCGYDEGIPP